MANHNDKKDGGYSREGLWGEIIHYDAEGHKIGESWPGLFGDYTDFDADGKKIGHSQEHLYGGGYTHYDKDGHKTGSSNENFSGGYTHVDNTGYVTGHSGRSVFDVKSEEEIQKTGSLYGTSEFYPHDGQNPAPSESGKEVPTSKAGTSQDGNEGPGKGWETFCKLERIFMSPWLWLAILAVLVIYACLRIWLGGSK